MTIFDFIDRHPILTFFLALILAQAAIYLFGILVIALRGPR